MTEEAAVKEETEWLSKLSASGEETKCLVLVELKTEDRERVEPVTQEPDTDGNLVRVATRWPQVAASFAPDGHQLP